MALALPSSTDGPQASPQLLRVAEDDAARERFDRIDVWQVPAREIPADSVLDLALALPARPVAGAVLADSLRFVAEAGKLALELVARGRLRACLARRGERWEARWVPVTDAADDTARVQLLTRVMPGALSEGIPHAVVADVLGVLVDACARGLLANATADVGSPGPAADDGEPLHPSIVDAWLERLASEEATVAGDPWELAELAEQIDAWWGAGQRYAATRMFRTCFRLVAPEVVADAGLVTPGGAEVAAVGIVEGSPIVEPPWRVEILLQSKDDPSVLVPAADVWARSERLTALGRMLENPQERLLGGLGHALALWPDLEPALHQAAPTEVLLDADGAHRFLQDAAPALEQGGFAVLAPRWWSERLRVSLSVQSEEDWGEGSGLFGLDGLCAYEWRVAIGDARLTASELEALAELKLPLIRTRGQWVALRAEDVQWALRFLEGRRQRGRASAAALLRTGLGLDGAAVQPQAPRVEIEASGWLGDLLSADENRKLVPLPTPAAFVGELRPYQQRGLAWMAFLSSVGLGACLADDMGLGKTIQLLALLLAERDHRRPASGTSRSRRPGPTLLICPVSVVGNWEREAHKFAPSLSVHVHHGRERLTDRAFAKAARASDLVITTYALALRDRETLAAVKWDRLVLDEAQNIKSIDTKQTRAIRTLTARHRIALTGTPVENRLSELHSIMDFLNPGLLGTASGFRETFATPIERYRDGVATQRLREATGPFILRRLKTDRDIISDLPEKIEMRVDCNLSSEQATLYQAVVDEMIERAEDLDGIERAGVVLAALMKLKQVCNHPAHVLKDRSQLHGRSGKLTRLEEILDEALAQGDSALIFTQFAEFGRQLRGYLQERLGREVLFLHGGTTRNARDEMVTRFQSEGGPSVFVLSLKAGGTGLNLTAANHVIHFDRWWNPAVEDQATDRAFRIGQRKNVQVRKMMCVGTLEERIDRLLADKRDLADRIVGTGEAWLTELDTGQLRELVALSIDAVAA